jgi:uncharacterized membrane protein YgdD (TMEM256/DUF423 family)
MNWILIGAITAFCSVALGAFGAHSLKNKLSEYALSIFQTGVQYAMYHSLALVLIGLCTKSELNGKLLNLSALSFFVGIILFSGSLFAIALSGNKQLGAITPIGGLLFLIGWFLLAFSSLKQS